MPLVAFAAEITLRHDQHAGTRLRDQLRRRHFFSAAHREAHPARAPVQLPRQRLHAHALARIDQRRRGLHQASLDLRVINRRAQFNALRRRGLARIQRECHRAAQQPAQQNARINSHKIIPSQTIALAAADIRARIPQRSFKFGNCRRSCPRPAPPRNLAARHAFPCTGAPRLCSALHKGSESQSTIRDL